MPLNDLLLEVLPALLPKDPAQRIKGVNLIPTIQTVLRDKYQADYADAAIRQTLSSLVKTPNSPIARVENQHGYYLRPGWAIQSGAAERSIDPTGQASELEGVSPRDLQCEEKFRAFYMRYSRLGDDGEIPRKYPVQIEHTQFRRGSSGQNTWKFPDLVVLEWESDVIKDAQGNLDSDILENLPNASAIREMSSHDFNLFLDQHEIAPRIIASAPDRLHLDWEHLDDLRSVSSQNGGSANIDKLLRWISHCLHNRRAVAYDSFLRLRRGFNSQASEIRPDEYIGVSLRSTIRNPQ